MRHRAWLDATVGSMLLTVALPGSVYAGLGWLHGFGSDITATLPWLGEAQAPGFVGTVHFAAGALGLSVLLTWHVAGLFICVLRETVVGSLELRRYPQSGPETLASVIDHIRAGLRLFGVVLLVNIAVLVSALLFPRTHPA